MKREKINDEALRQGREYSRKIIEENDSFWDSQHWDYVRRERSRWMINKAKKILHSSQPWKVLEVGCGIGFTTLEVARSAKEHIQSLCAIDVSTKAIEVARRLLSEQSPEMKQKIIFREENIFEHTDGPYNIIYSHEVIEHIPDIVATFQKMHDLLYPGGLIMISTPNRLRLYNRLRKIFNRDSVLIDPYHIKEFSINELKGEAKPLVPLVYTGRTLLDERTLGNALSFRNDRLLSFIKPFVQYIVRSRANFYAGALIPGISSELMFLYQKNNILKSEFTQ